MLPRKKWYPVAALVLIIQAMLEAFAAYRLITLNMLPDRYLIAVLVVLAAGIAVTAILLLVGSGHGPGKGRMVRRIIAVILAAVIGVGSVVVTAFTGQVSETVQTVTDTETNPSSMIGVYVQKDDKAQQITDAKSYSFGIMGGFDRDNTEKAVDDINNVISGQIKTTEYKSMVELAQALYAEDVKAIILNEAYVDVLKDTDQFSDFDDATRLLYEIPIYSSDDGSDAVEPSSASTSSEKYAEISSRAIDANITDGPFTIYISGSDTRSQILDVSRSDVNILMTVNPKTKQILLLNTPRDYYIPNPAGDGAYDKLTHLGLYGTDCSMQGLADLYDTTIDYYAQINFTGFEKLIDEIGGITVNSDVAFESQGYSFTEGENHMDGKQALAFARDRYHQASGDNARGRHQMMVIQAVIEKISNGGTDILLNYSSIMDSISGMFATSLKADEIAALVKMQLDDGAKWNVRSYAVTGKGGSDYTYSMPTVKAYVMYQDKDMVRHASELIDKVENGETLTDEDANS